MTATSALIVLMLLSLWSVGAAPAEADDLFREDPEAAQELADRYAPVMVLKAQDAPCDEDGEPYAPTSVEIVLNNPEIVLRQVGRGDPVIATAPTASDLFGLSEGFYLDFPGGALSPGCIYETDFNRYSDGEPVVVYAHIVQQSDHPDKLALQYWFYWYYNDWNNKHEGDWEGIQILFDAASIEEALATEPTSVGYAQHEGGEQADWDDSKLERQGTHPLVYSSAGSHASYYGSALYIGRSGSEGFGCDNTDGPSDMYDSEVVVLPDSVEDADDSLAWLAYGGRWGERQGGAFNGPTGPAAKERWLEPIDWHDDLRTASVIIPAGDSEGLSIINAFCDIVEWGAGKLIQLKTSPFQLAVATLVVFFVVSWLVRRTDWSVVPPSPVVKRR
ncbi:MAG: Vps62-related protein, partial [Acidimicrobiales bacterium]